MNLCWPIPNRNFVKTFKNGLQSDDVLSSEPRESRLFVFLSVVECSVKTRLIEQIWRAQDVRTWLRRHKHRMKTQQYPCMCSTEFIEFDKLCITVVSLSVFWNRTSLFLSRFLVQNLSLSHTHTHTHTHTQSLLRNRACTFAVQNEPVLSSDSSQSNRACDYMLDFSLN